MCVTRPIPRPWWLGDRPGLSSIKRHSSHEVAAKTLSESEFPCDKRDDVAPIHTHEGWPIIKPPPLPCPQLPQALNATDLEAGLQAVTHLSALMCLLRCREKGTWPSGLWEGGDRSGVEAALAGHSCRPTCGSWESRPAGRWCPENYWEELGIIQMLNLWSADIHSFMSS